MQQCSVSHKVVELSSSGKSELTDHGKGKKHRNALSKVQNFFKPRSSMSSSETAPLTPSLSSDAMKAEIIWTLKSVMNGNSARLNKNMNETLVAMFPEFEATKSFQLS